VFIAAGLRAHLDGVVNEQLNNYHLTMAATYFQKLFIPTQERYFYLVLKHVIDNLFTFL